MLQDLRDKAQGFVAWIIIGMIAVTFILWGTHSAFVGNNEQIVAKVDGQKITLREVDDAYQRLMNQNNNPSLKQLDPAEVKKKLLQSLIDEAILLQEQRKLGMHINAEQVNATLYTIPFLQESGQFSEETYFRFLQNAHFTDQGFRTLIRDNLLKRQLEQGLIQTAFSLDYDVNLAAKFVFQERDFKKATLKRDAYKDAVDLSDEKLKAYYQSHLPTFMSEEQIAIEYVMLSMAELEKQINPSDKELEDFYNKQKDLFSTPAKVHVKHIMVEIPEEATPAKEEEAKKKAEKISAELAQGGSFEELAKKYSDDKKSADKGGELAWITAGSMSPDFEKVAFSLDKPTQISKPFKTEFGYHILKLIEKQPAKAHAYAEVKSDVLTKFKQQAVQDKFYHMIDEVSVIAYEQPDSLQPIVDKYGLTSIKTGYFSKNNPPKEVTILANPNIMNLAFSQTIKDDKNNSELIPLGEENYVVLRVNEVRPTKQIPFAEVKDKVKAMLLDEKLNELTKAGAQKLVAEIKAGKDSISLSWQDFDKVTRANKELSPAILEAVFALPKPIKEKERLVDMARLENGDYAIIWLTKVKDGTGENLSLQEKQSYQSSLTNILGELEFALYSTELAKEAKVKKYTENI